MAPLLLRNGQFARGFQGDLDGHSLWRCSSAALAVGEAYLSGSDVLAALDVGPSNSGGSR